MRLLFVLNSSQYFVLNRMSLAKAAQGAGYEVAVAAVDDDADSTQAIRDAGMQFHVLSLSRRGFNPFSTARSLWSLFRIFRRVQPDIIHAWTIKAIVLSGILARLMKLPMVALIAGRGHSFDGGPLLRNLAKGLYRIALGGKLTHVVFQNSDDLDYFIDQGLVTKQQSHLIPGSGVDVTRFAFRDYARSQAQRVILLASRMLKQKGILDFLEAAKRVRKTYPHTVFRLVGAPDPGNPHSFTEAELQQMASDAGVEYQGFSRDMVETLGSCDIYCLPTYYREGIPMTLMQAMALGRPVVTTPVAGCRDVVRDGHTGLLVPPRQPHALADAICRILESDELATELAQRAHVHIKAGFSADVIHARYLGLYPQLVDLSSRRVLQEELS